MRGIQDRRAPRVCVHVISLAGGFQDYSNGSNIRIIRPGKGGMVSARFASKAAAAEKPSALATNLELKPGDTIIVP